MGTFWSVDVQKRDNLLNDGGWDYELRTDVPCFGKEIRKYVATRRVDNYEQLKAELDQLERETLDISDEVRALVQQLESPPFKGRIKDADVAIRKKSLNERLVKLRETNGDLKSQVRELRVKLAPHGRQYYMDSVTDILKSVGGIGDGLLAWAVERTQMDILAQKLPGMTYEEHLVWLRWLAAHHKKDPRSNKQDNKRTMEELASLAITTVGYNPPEFRMTLLDLARMLDKATDARKRSLEEAGELGTRAHELYEIFLRNNGQVCWGGDGTQFLLFWQNGEEYEIDMSLEPVEVQRAFKTFEAFWREEQLETIGCEILLADIEMGVGGTLDAIVLKPPSTLLILDWKTSNRVKETFMLQVAAYARLYDLAGHGWPERAYIVRCDKVVADLQVVPVYETKEEYLELVRMFQAAMRTDRWFSKARRHIKKFNPVEIEEDEAQSTSVEVVEMTETEVSAAFAVFPQPASTEAPCPF